VSHAPACDPRQGDCDIPKPISPTGLFEHQEAYDDAETLDTYCVCCIRCRALCNLIAKHCESRVSPTGLCRRQTVDEADCITEEHRGLCLPSKDYGPRSSGPSTRSGSRWMRDHQNSGTSSGRIEYVLPDKRSPKDPICDRIEGLRETAASPHKGKGGAPRHPRPR
jgi:hypothetical protein